jgi:multiple antibiotic resistance protein
MQDFFMCFVPLAVAIDAISLVPVFIALTSSLNAAERRKVILQSMITAAAVGIAFTLVGKALLSLMGIQQVDFQIAGGIILLGLALPDILGKPLVRRDVSGLTVGVVPLGVPLLVGPGVLTAMLLLSDKYHYALPIAALLANLGLAMLGLWFSTTILRVIGDLGTKALTRIMAILLAAYAVMLVRDGIQQIMKS